MATKRKSSDPGRKGKDTKALGEAVRAEALRRVGQAIVDAACAYERALPELTSAAGLEIKDVPRGDDEAAVSAVLSALGFALLDDNDGKSFVMDYDNRQTVSRLREALRPPTRPNKNEAIELAVNFVREYASAYNDAPAARTSEHQANFVRPMTRSQIAQSLVMVLTVQVHPRFELLGSNIGRVEGLLARHSSGKGRKVKAGPTRITAAGILEKLNELSQFTGADGALDRPLGIALSTRGISNALASWRTTSRRK